MPELQIGTFTVTITTTGVIDAVNSTVELTSPASVVAGIDNVTLLLTLKDEYNNLVSGTFGVKVQADGSWFDEVAVVFTDGVANITFGVTVAAVHTDIPVLIVTV